MIEFIKNWVLNIAVVVVVLVLVEILIPPGRVKKFLDVITGLIIIITVIHPFIKLFFRGYDSSLLDEIERSFGSVTTTGTVNAGFSEEQVKQIVRVYREKLIERIEQVAGEVDEISDARADVIINEDYSSKYFGEIKKVYLYVLIGNSSARNAKKDGERNGDSYKIAPVEKVNKVRISVGNPEKTGQEGIGGEKHADGGIEDKTGDSIEIDDKNEDEHVKIRIAETLENRISSVLAIKREDIVISYK